jgi:hypothetical protein
MFFLMNIVLMRMNDIVYCRILHTLPHGSLHTQGNEDNKMSYSMLEKLRKTSWYENNDTDNTHTP